MQCSRLPGELERLLVAALGLMLLVAALGLMLLVAALGLMLQTAPGHG